MVDAIVVVAPNEEAELHPMSYQETLVNPAYTGTIKCPHDEVQRLKLDERKIIARRAFFHLKPDAVVNLGIGLPEGVAAVAEEEGMLAHVTLTTEPGVFGGLPVGGHNFGPAVNPSAQIEMNEMFDFYNGGGLDMSFLGAAQIGRNGDVNVRYEGCATRH
jgi:propionate CoA-transferase